MKDLVRIADIVHFIVAYIIDFVVVQKFLGLFDY